MCARAQMRDAVCMRMFFYKFRVLGVQMQSRGPGAVVRNSKGVAACLGTPQGSPGPGLPQNNIQLLISGPGASLLSTRAKTRGFHTQLDEGPETP